MKHNLIKTENYFLIGGDDLKRGWFYCVRTKSIFQDEGEDVLCCNGDIRIVAHLPLNNSPILEGVDLLPPLEDDVKDLAESEYGTDIDSIRGSKPYDLESDRKNGFIRGYKKAKEAYKYTEEDLYRFGEKCFNYKHISVETLLDKFKESLQQPKLPIAFECEMVDFDVDMGLGEECIEYNQYPKTKTNSQGQTVLVGKYVF